MSNTYGYDDVYLKTLDYFGGDQLAATVAVTKYLLKDGDRYLEQSPDDMIRNRLVPEFHRIESKYPNPLTKEEIFESLDHFKYIIPQGSPLFGIGNNFQISSISNCFVLESPYDSYSGIMKTDEQLAQVMKRRGGVGIALESLRPKGSKVNNSARTSDGVKSFISRYSNTTKEVAQGGRRGALLMGLDCRHPDIEDFIVHKRDISKRVTGANLSVKWHDDFLEAVKNDSEYTLRYPVDVPIDQAKFTKVVKAKYIWDLFVESSWMTGDPGCIFWDTVTNQSISDCYSDVGFKSLICNPCGEVYLNSSSSCLLLLLNLTSFVKSKFSETTSFDFELFETHIR